MTLILDFQGKILKLLYLRNGRVNSLGMKGLWVGYDVGCTMGLTLCHSAWQIDWPSNGSMWNSYSFQPHEPVGPWMGYSFTDLGSEGCCCLWTPCFNWYANNLICMANLLTVSYVKCSRLQAFFTWTGSKSGKYGTSLTHSLARSIDRSISRSINQSINQSINPVWVNELVSVRLESVRWEMWL